MPLDSCINAIFEPGSPGNATDSGAITTPRFPQSVAVIEVAIAAETVDAFLGEIMLEAASAADLADAGFLQISTIDEAASASSTQDASIPVVFTSWSTTDHTSNIVLSNANLTATSNNAATGGVRSQSGKSSGKLYWEVTMGTWTDNTTAVGLAISTYDLTSAPVGALTGSAGTNKLGGINVNGSGAGSLGSRASGDIIGIAIDLAANLVWFRVAPSGNWNGSGTANPATGTGGANISALTQPLFPAFSDNANAQSATANFGASAFSGAVPSGFSAGVPA